MFNNEYLAATVRTACGKVTRDDPVVRMQTRDAMLVVTALQGPLSELKGSDHLMCDTDANLVEAKYWYVPVFITHSISHLIPHTNSTQSVYQTQQSHITVASRGMCQH